MTLKSIESLFDRMTCMITASDKPKDVLLCATLIVETAKLEMAIKGETVDRIEELSKKFQGIGERAALASMPDPTTGVPQ